MIGVDTDRERNDRRRLFDCSLVDDEVVGLGAIRKARIAANKFPQHGQLSRYGLR